MLSVPIPVHKDMKLIVRYFPLSLSEKPKEFIFSVGEYITISELRQKIKDKLPAEKTYEPPFICKVRNRNLIDLIGRETFNK